MLSVLWVNRSQISSIWATRINVFSLWSLFSEMVQIFQTEFMLLKINKKYYQIMIRKINHYMVSILIWFYLNPSFCSYNFSYWNFTWNLFYFCMFRIRWYRWKAEVNSTNISELYFKVAVGIFCWYKMKFAIRGRVNFCYKLKLPDV